LKKKGKKGEVKLTESEKLQPLENIVPIVVQTTKGKLSFQGCTNRKKLFKDALLLDGTKISKAKFRDVTRALISTDDNRTEKQIDWDSRFPGFMKNFSLLQKTKVRIRLKSHLFMRFANLLPRDRNALCSRCNSCIENSDHILLNCEGTRSDAQLAISALKKYFNLNIDLNEFLTILQKDLRIRLFQIVSLYCSWNVRCKLKHGETIPPLLLAIYGNF
jgi:hypothetical protein